MAPYLLFGFLVAGILSALISQRIVRRHLGGRGGWSLVKASIFGIPLPLCSCGVIPVSMSLHRHGASKGATISFLLSTPQTGVDGILVTLSLLGPVFAVFRPLSAFVTGILGGAAVNIFAPKPAGRQTDEEIQCSEPCCQGESKSDKLKGGLKYGFVNLPRDIGAAMVIGIVIAAAISAFVPEGFFANKLGAGIISMLVMVILGVPLYVCATASVPVAAAMILKGLSPGAALVFLMTGPATNAASFATIWKVMGARTALVYLLSVVVCALAAGLLLNWIFAGTQFEVITHARRMLPAIVRYASAVVLAIILGYAFISARIREHARCADAGNDHKAQKKT